mmetsp:Transcript_13296/g.22575  ORF Transcript_13296/g.22575 Transcript_13296/m.22575 type:complete len:401 (-) Transcript_13296:1271-2473(-)
MIVAEFKETPEDIFAFRFQNEKVVIGVCEWCNEKTILKSICQCKVVRYCNDDCLEKDKKFHLPKCSALADRELQMLDDQQMSDTSRKGLTGLKNLGNTCYMNSSIQCLSNTFELTKYILDQKYKSLIEREQKNPLGTGGRIVMAYAKLINEMWKGQASMVSPDLFKRILGQYNMTFEGYGQHDSQECINTILDFMSEDLFKKEKKPYVEQTDSENKSDEEASLEAWNKHIFRNESIICDLFHGQFKSTLNCSICKRISITFDPFLMVNLPIPNVKTENFDCYLIQYDLVKNGTYKNLKMSVSVRDTDRVQDFRDQVQKVYGIDSSSFVMTWVQYNKLKHMFNTQLTINEIDTNHGVLLLMEIPERLKPKLPPLELVKKDDSNYGIDPEWVKIVFHIHKDG